VKSDIFYPLAFGVVLLSLFVIRLAWSKGKHVPTKST